MRICPGQVDICSYCHKTKDGSRIELDIMRGDKKIGPRTIFICHQCYDNEVVGELDEIGSITESLDREIELVAKVLKGIPIGIFEDEFSWIGANIPGCIHEEVDMDDCLADVVIAKLNDSELPDLLSDFSRQLAREVARSIISNSEELINGKCIKSGLTEEFKLGDDDSPVEVEKKVAEIIAVVIKVCKEVIISNDDELTLK